MHLNRTRKLSRQIALFDSDCLEPVEDGGVPLSSLPGFGLRPRMQPKADKIEALYALARRHDLTVLFTQCLSARAVNDGEPAGTLVVPTDGDGCGWRERVRGARLINLGKPSAGGARDRGFICRYFDAFQHNANARALLAELDVPLFVLFGNGFDLCVDSSAKGLLAAGYRVHFLTDVAAPSATGYGPYGTEESGKATLDYLVKIGMTTGTLEEMLRQAEGDPGPAAG